MDSKQVFLCCEGQLVRGLRERGQAKEMGDLKERDGRPKGMGGGGGLRRSIFLKKGGIIREQRVCF